MRTLEQMQALQNAQQMNQPMNAGQHAHPMANPLPTLQSYGNPIAQGANSGIQAARQSLEGDEEQKRRAMGQAMMHIFSNLYREPSFGLGALARSVNESVIPAVSAHNRAREHEREVNLSLIQRQDKLDKIAREEELEREKMNETKRYHDAHLSAMLQKARTNHGEGGIANVSLVEQLVQSGEAPANAVPMASLPKNVQLAYHKDMMAEANKGHERQNVLKTLHEMQKLSDEFPDLDTDFNQIFLDPENSRTKSISSLARIGMADKKSRAAIEKYAKLTSNLVTSKVMSMSGKAVTDVMKRNIMEGVPRFGMTKAAKDFVIKELEDEVSPLVERSRWSAKGLQHGYYVPPSLDSESLKQHVAEQGNPISDFDDYRSKYPELKNVNDELMPLILQKMKQKGIE